MMARLPLVLANGEPEILKEVFQKIRSVQGIEPHNLHRTLGHFPELLDAFLDVAWALRWKSATERQLRQVLILRWSQLLDSQYEWSHHVPMSLEAGVTEEQIAELGRWRDSEHFDGDTKLALEYTEALVTSNKSSEALFQRMVDRFGDRGTLELGFSAFFYVMVGRVIAEFEIDLEPGKATSS